MSKELNQHPGQAEGAQGEPLPYWEPCNPACDPELNGFRDRKCSCAQARAALAQPSPKCPTCDSTGEADSGGVMPWAEAAMLPCPNCVQPSPAPERSTVYVEARQCDECQHGGINDSAVGLAACHDCDWTGPDPAEDKCPGCHSENCMAAACPQCGARYALVASEEIAAPVAQAGQAGQVPEGYMLITQDQVERHATTAWECPPQSRVVLVSTLKRLHEKNVAAPQPAGGADHE